MLNIITAFISLVSQHTTTERRD